MHGGHGGGGAHVDMHWQTLQRTRRESSHASLQFPDDRCWRAETGPHRSIPVAGLEEDGVGGLEPLGYLVVNLKGDTLGGQPRGGTNGRCIGNA